MTPRTEPSRVVAVALVYSVLIIVGVESANAAPTVLQEVSGKLRLNEASFTCTITTQLSVLTDPTPCCRHHCRCRYIHNWYTYAETSLLLVVNDLGRFFFSFFEILTVIENFN